MAWPVGDEGEHQQAQLAIVERPAAAATAVPMLRPVVAMGAAVLVVVGAAVAGVVPAAVFAPVGTAAVGAVAVRVAVWPIIMVVLHGQRNKSRYIGSQDYSRYIGTVGGFPPSSAAGPSGCEGTGEPAEQDRSGAGRGAGFAVWRVARPRPRDLPCELPPHGVPLRRHPSAPMRGVPPPEEASPMLTTPSKLTRLRSAVLAAVAGAALLGAGTQAARAEFINVLTGGTSGVYYPLGVALTKIYAESIPDARPTAQATKASVENLNLLDSGKGEIAFTLGDSLGLAWAGDADAGFKKKLEGLRTVAAIYPNYIQVVASQESGIKTLADLKGKRVSVGAAKSGTEINARAILGAAGLSYDDLGKVEYLPFAESVELMKNRQLDATLQSAGLGVASIRDLASSVPITVVEVPAADVEKIGLPYVAVTIPAGTYTGQDADVSTAGVQNFLVTRADLSDDLVYAMTKSMFDHLPDMAAAHAAAKGIKLDEAAKNSPVPLHPGAERFYKEKGAM